MLVKVSGKSGKPQYVNTDCPQEEHGEDDQDKSGKGGSDDLLAFLDVFRIAGRGEDEECSVKEVEESNSPGNPYAVRKYVQF